MKQLQQRMLQPLIAGGCLLAVVGVLLNLPPQVRPQSLPEANWDCQKKVQPEQTLSRQQLAKLLSIPERSARRQVEHILQRPYCRLPSLSLRAGATTERDAYRLGFDPQTALVVLYEGHTYVGYGFQRP